MRLRRLVAAVALVSGLGLGGAAAAAATDGASTPGRAGAGIADQSDTGLCARLAARVAEVPGIRDRIRERLDAIDERVAAVRSDAARERLRARLQPRIDALEALDTRLAQQVALVEERCPAPA